MLRQVEISEDDTEILTLTVWLGGSVTTDRPAVTGHSAVTGKLLETMVPVLGPPTDQAGTRRGRVSLGVHPAADGLRRLAVSPRAPHRHHLPGRTNSPAGRKTCGVCARLCRLSRPGTGGVVG
ncbi:hypothetical protein RHA1_ro10165 (plasmid) [Rhodococcus jostii RHA1]|uniref:Uncharacterized protein n=1 Tax=Rhodococcus jostii (strain RHA1) TaxID=101510 RepID=Q0RWH8_RHOJR|nr:hypothetical protein RHA1_ro10165 [Rhodococcus jostii RHA1]